MKKNLYKICIILSLVIFALLIASIIFPVSEKGISDSNISIDDLKSSYYINNMSSVELRYPVQDEKIKGLILYFDINEMKNSEMVFQNKTSENIYGIINYNVLNDQNEILYTGYLDVNDIVSTMRSDKIIGTELKIELPKISCEVITVILSGENIPPNIKIRLFENSESNSKLAFVNYGIGYIRYPLYQMEVEVLEYKYTWDLGLILLLLVAVVILTKENWNDIDKNKSKCAG